MHPLNYFNCLALSVFILILAACTTTNNVFQEGQALVAEGKYTEGFAKLEEAIKQNPGNAEYRIYLANTRLNVVNNLNLRAQAAQAQNRLTEAENLFRSVLEIDNKNSVAKTGINTLNTERKHRQMIQDAEAAFKKDKLDEAESVLRSVLIENPNQKEALNLQSRITDKKYRDRKTEAKLGAAARMPVTLEFRDAPLRSVLNVVSKVSGINFFYDKDLRPDLKISINTTSTPIEDTLRLLLLTNQLDYKVLNEKSVLIFPSTPQKLKDYQNLTVRSFYLANADAKQTANTLKTILKTRDLVVNEKLNLIIMRDTPEAIRLAEKLIAMEDIGEAEVMLEVEILEVKRTRLQQLGILWPSQLTLTVIGSTSSSGTTTTTGTPTLDTLKNLSASSVSAALSSMIFNAQKQDSDSNILANPRIRVRNREKAKIVIGDKVPVITTTSTSTGFVSDSVNYVDVGLTLEVEPNIYLDDEVAIKVSMEVSSIVKEVTSRSGTLSYQIGTRRANTVLKLKDGETQVLGGLISDQDRVTADKVPGLGDLPVLGRLFSSRNTNSEKTELILAITPHLVRTVRRPDLVVSEFDSGTETNLGSRALSLGPVTSDSDNKTDSSTNAKTKLPTTLQPSTSGQLPPLQPATTSSNPNSVKTVLASGTNFNLSWQGPREVKAGDQFSLVLKLQTQDSVSGLPLLIGFDPSVMQVVSVNEGDFLKQANGQTNFTSRTDQQGGQIFAGSVRQGSATNGLGSVLMINLKAIKATPATKVQLLSITPEPALSQPTALPLDHSFKINP